MTAPTPDAASDAPGPPDPTRSVRATLRGISTFVGPTSAVSALLYYFGWTRTMVQATLLGLDESLLGYSSQDYLLRSMSSMYTPLLIGLMATLLGLGLHALVVAWARRLGLPIESDEADRSGWRPMRRLIAIVAVVGAASLALGYAGAQVSEPSRELYAIAPAGVTVGVLLLVFAANLYRRFLARPAPAGATPARTGSEGLAVGCVVMLVLVSLFWNVGRYAAVKGNQLADQVISEMPFRPGVILYSEKRLYLQAPVVETKLDPEDATYKYAYSGLKLLFRSNGRYFLRPSDTAFRLNIIIPDGLDIRLELFRP